MSIFTSSPIPNISYSNTFGQWVSTTNSLVLDHNNFASNNYVKSAGTLYLSDPTLALQTSNTNVQGYFQVTGVGSAGYVQNNLRVDGQVYFTNTILGITNTGQANIGGIIYALAPSTGLAVANNTTMGGYLTVGGNTNISNTLSVTGATTVNGATTISNTVSISGATTVSNNLTVTQNTAITHYLSVGNDITAVNETLSGSLTVIGPSFFNTVQTTGQFVVGGNFVLNGSTVYNANTFVINAGSSTGINSTFAVNRGSSGANASIRWNESSKYWDILDVNNGNNYSQIVTANLISDSLSSTLSTPYVASQKAANTLYTYLTANVASLQSQISSNATTLYAAVTSAYNQANTAANSFIGTSGTVTPNSGIITFTSTNGVTIVGSGNTFTYNTPQDVRTTASPTFASLSLTAPLAIAQGGTGATSAGQALTNLLPTGTTAGYVLATGGPGSFYWAAGGTGGGGGATPGTTISSTYNQYTANGSGVSYTTPVYVAGTDQLKIYFDGVRQHPGQYTETTGNTGGSSGYGIVTFGSAVPSGVSILAEVDGYIINPYYANNIAYTVNSNIGSSANTIQLAIDGLTSKVVTNYANTLISYSNPTWITSLASTKITGTIPAANVSGLATSATTDTTSASNITSGTLSASRLQYSMNQAVATSSDVQFNSIGIGTAGSGTTGEIRATNAITSYYSDDNLKIRLGKIENALDKIMTLDGFYYEESPLAESLGYKKHRQVGLSAQQTQKVMPEIVVPAPIDPKYLTIHYDRMIPLIVEAIKELKQEIESLKGNNK